MREKGTLSRWNDDKGYGFVEPASDGEQLFVHISAFSSRDRRPQTGQIISYQPSTDKHGRRCAINAALPGSKPRPTRNKNAATGSASTALALVFLGIVAIAVLTGKLPMIVAVAYTALSVVTFIEYAVDKSAAKRGAWRTQENTLHLFALAGGWPGALIAQQTLRHKSSKQSFRFAFWITVLLNLGFFVWLFTAAGATLLRSL